MLFLSSLTAFLLILLPISALPIEQQALSTFPEPSTLLIEIWLTVGSGPGNTVYGLFPSGAHLGLSKLA